MRVTDLMHGDMLDLANLGLSGATGISAECELAQIEELSATESVVYTDLVNLNAPTRLPASSLPALGANHGAGKPSNHTTKGIRL